MAWLSQTSQRYLDSEETSEELILVFKILFTILDNLILGMKFA